MLLCWHAGNYLSGSIPSEWLLDSAFTELDTLQATDNLVMGGWARAIYEVLSAICMQLISCPSWHSIFICHSLCRATACRHGVLWHGAKPQEPQLASQQ